jgi:peptidoglycan/LPS O-acetylase OafA/YrhL
MVIGFLRLASVNFVTWRLEAEVQFYILAPLLCCFSAIRSAAVRRGVMVSFILISMYVFTLTGTKASWDLPRQLDWRNCFEDRETTS